MDTVLITGANRGIGLALCKEYLAKGYEVIAVCRKASSELLALNLIVKEGIDVTDPRSLQRLQEDLKHKKIKLLINNAGNCDPDQETLEQVNAPMLVEHFLVHVVGSYNVTKSLRSLLDRNAKVIFISSRMGSITVNQEGSGTFTGGEIAYRTAKAAQNMFASNLRYDPAFKEIAIGIIHPGYVRTRMTEGMGNLEPQESAARVADVIDRLVTMETTGRFWNAERNGQAIPW